MRLRSGRKAYSSTIPSPSFPSLGPLGTEVHSSHYRELFIPAVVLVSETQNRT